MKMKKLAYHILFAAAVISSCAKEINPESTANDPRAEAFKRGQAVNDQKPQSYFIKRLIEHPDARSTEVHLKFSELNMPYIGTGNWEAVHPAFSQAIQDWLNDEKKRQDPGVLIGIEMTSYVYLYNYIFQAEANQALAEATAFYLRTLMELGEASEWSILARALTVSKGALTEDEYRTFARHIRKNAEDILKNGPEKSYSEDLQARQIEAAQEAVALLTDQRN